MKHIKQFESYRVERRREEIIKESVLQVNDIYKVKVMVDIPQSLLNAYVKKVKDTAGKNLRQFYGDMDLAEEIVKYVTMNFIDSEKIPTNALVGGAQTQGQAQPQAQPQAETETQTETEEPAQVQVQTEAQPEETTQAQPQEEKEENFEEVAEEGGEEKEETTEEGGEEKEETTEEGGEELPA